MLRKLCLEIFVKHLVRGKVEGIADHAKRLDARPRKYRPDIDVGEIRRAMMGRDGWLGPAFLDQLVTVVSENEDVRAVRMREASYEPRCLGIVAVPSVSNVGDLSDSRNGALDGTLEAGAIVPTLVEAAADQLVIQDLMLGFEQNRTFFIGFMAWYSGVRFSPFCRST